MTDGRGDKKKRVRKRKGRKTRRRSCVSQGERGSCGACTDTEISHAPTGGRDRVRQVLDGEGVDGSECEGNGSRTSFLPVTRRVAPFAELRSTSGDESMPSARTLLTSTGLIAVRACMIFGRCCALVVLGVVLACAGRGLAGRAQNRFVGVEAVQAHRQRESKRQTLRRRGPRVCVARHDQGNARLAKFVSFS